MDIRFLATTADKFEIIVATILVIVTIIVLYFLYRNIAYEIAELHKNKLAMKARREQGELDSEDKDSELLEFSDPKKMTLFSLINRSISLSKEGELSAFYLINIDNFRRVTDGATQKSINKVITELDKRLKKYGDKLAITGHYKDDIFLYYLENNKANSSDIKVQEKEKIDLSAS